MRQRMLDTDILSYVLRQREPAVSRAQDYIYAYGSLSISVISYYEVLRGLRYSNATRLLDVFEWYVATNPTTARSTSPYPLAAPGRCSPGR